MEQYLQLAREVKQFGTLKPAARSGMPGTISLFGYQNRYDLSKGFPQCTTKKISFKNVVVELLWFLRGDTNIKFLDEYGVRKLWHQDAYNYYVKIASANTGVDANDIYRKNPDETFSMFSFEEFCEVIKNTDRNDLPAYGDYVLGECGFQYGKVWRNWDDYEIQWQGASGDVDAFKVSVDQIKKVLTSLIKTPESRRHIVTAIDPANDEDLALYWCHALFQFNCRPLNLSERFRKAIEMGIMVYSDRLNDDGTVMIKNGVITCIEDAWDKFVADTQFDQENAEINHTSLAFLDFHKVPKYYLDCLLFQRSADLMLGVPYNIASYALIIEIFARWTNMIPGHLVHTFGDVHIYENHLDAINIQLNRTPGTLPKMKFTGPYSSHKNFDLDNLQNIIESLKPEDFILEDYNHQGAIEAKLSTGLK